MWYSIVVFLGLMVLGSGSDISATAKTTRLFDDYWQWRLYISPHIATAYEHHDAKYATRLPDMTEDSIDIWKRVAERFLERAEAINDLELSEEMRISLDILKSEIMYFVEGIPYKGYLHRVVTNKGGFCHSLHRTISAMRADSEEDFENIFARLHAIPKYVDQHIDLMRKGLQMGFKQSSKDMAGVAFQVYLITFKDAFYILKFDNISSENITEDKKIELQKRARHIIDERVHPSYIRLAEFYKNEYENLPNPGVGVGSLPGGKELYQQILKYYTTTNLTAYEVHMLGLKEVEKIKRNMLEVVELMGHRNLTLKEFTEMSRANESNYFNNATHMIDSYTEVINEVIQPRLLKVFHKIPKLGVVVEGDDNPMASSAYYLGGSASKGIPGRFMIPIHGKGSKDSLTTLSLHEASPGHHFHFSFITESETLPVFRRKAHRILEPPSDFPNFGAFTEGWALYAETLGFEMGLFDDLMQRFGHYGSSMFRAARLVVDTGLHAFNWSKERAVEYFLENTAINERTIRMEVDRYLEMPGQACSYKIGEIKILQLRKHAQDQLKHKYDIRDFHDAVLNCFGPLDILEKCVNIYIEKKLNMI